MPPLPTAASNTPFAEHEKRAYKTRTSSKRRRFFLFLFATLAFTAIYLSTTSNTSPSTLFASFWDGLKSLFGCQSKQTAMSSSTTHSAEGWHSRSQGHLSASEFKPKQSDLLLTVLVNSQVEPEGFTMALFKPSTVVDASGHILTLSHEDVVAFEHEIEAVKALPQTGEFMGQWRVSHPRTGYAIDRVLIPGEGERSVYGWSKTTTVLESVTKGHANLPNALQTLVGWAKEAREGYVRGNRDEAVIGKVMELVHA